MSKTGHTNCLLKSSTELHDFLLSASRSSFLLKSARNSSEFFDMKHAPFEEVTVAADTHDAEALAARKELLETLVTLVGEERATRTEAPSPGAEKKKLRKAQKPAKKVKASPRNKKGS